MPRLFRRHQDSEDLWWVQPVPHGCRKRVAPGVTHVVRVCCTGITQGVSQMRGMGLMTSDTRFLCGTPVACVAQPHCPRLRRRRRFDRSPRPTQPRAMQSLDVPCSGCFTVCQATTVLSPPLTPFPCPNSSPLGPLGPRRTALAAVAAPDPVAGAVLCAHRQTAAACRR
jgi:hypothetical protein